MTDAAAAFRREKGVFFRKTPFTRENRTLYLSLSTRNHPPAAAEYHTGTPKEERLSWVR